eukprot:TRINITY_DN731_c0_g1_i1.p1 TRINITY_DN731_c0_g1~~TRINITY_DN731_c0_g1_i1.p1  ORF type:complete len:261 (+),score=30.59 TRINITY_DN731_c0_g1_i1:106-888(+)
MEVLDEDHPPNIELSNEELTKVITMMRENHLIKDRTYHLKKYPLCFVGSEAVAFFLSNHFASNETDAINIGQQLMDSDLIHHVHDAHTFKNDFLFYRFKSDEETPFTGPSVAKVLKEGDIPIEGDLDMKGTIFWNKRYFVLRADEMNLYCFFDKLAPEPIRIIDLSDVELEVAECDCRSGSYCFVITSKKQMYVLCSGQSKVQLAWLQALTDLGIKFREEDIVTSANSIFDFSADDIDGIPVDLNVFQGNVCLVVNVASY